MPKAAWSVEVVSRQLHRLGFGLTYQGSQKSTHRLSSKRAQPFLPLTGLIVG